MKNEDNHTFDTIIIGGGFYGLRIAQFLRDELSIDRILVLEKEKKVMSRASYNNQARVHNGYHYPRSVLTALRSRVNLPVFVAEYGDAVLTDFTKYYGVATHFSKVSASQFKRFFERLGAPIESAPEALKDFDPKLMAEVFKVKEFAFNSAKLQRKLCLELSKRHIEVKSDTKVLKIEKSSKGIAVYTDSGEFIAKHVINATYSSINTINAASDLPIIPLKHELTEMCLVTVPDSIKNNAYTIMCGPFYSLMPFPDKDAFTLSHVRYTPHSEWYDSDVSVRDGHEYLDQCKKVSHFPQMIADVKRYMPELAKGIKYTGESLWEVKTVLPQSEGDDSRPILYLEHHGGLKNYICIMGGKIDNIYDVFKELKITYGKETS